MAGHLVQETFCYHAKYNEKTESHGESTLLRHYVAYVPIGLQNPLQIATIQLGLGKIILYALYLTPNQTMVILSFALLNIFYFSLIIVVYLSYYNSLLYCFFPVLP